MKNRYVINDEVTTIYIKFKGEYVGCLINTRDLPIADSFAGTWYGSQYKEGNQIYVTGTMHNKGNRLSLKLHRLLLNADDAMVVDHVNRNGLDNRRANIRLATLKENAQNLSLNKRSTTGYRGVSFKKDKNKYKAYLSIEKKQIHIGYFNTAEEANAAVITARKKHYPFSEELEAI